MKAFRPQLGFVPTFGGNRIPEAINHLVPHEKKAGTLGRLQPFVRARGIKIAADIVHVEAHHAGHMRAIHRRQNSLGPRQRTQFLCRKHHSGCRRDVAEKDHACSRGNRIIKKVQHLRRFLHRLGKNDFLNDNSVTLRSELPGLLASGMLLVRHQDFVARFHIHAIRDVAIRLGGIPQQGNLVPRAAHKRGQRIAKFIPCCISPDWVIFRILLIQLFGGVVRIENRTQHGRGAGTDRAVIQVNLVRGNKKLLSQFSPVGVFVFVVERNVGQGSGSIFELRKQQVAEANRSRDPCANGHKLPTIEQTAPPEGEGASCYAVARARASSRPRDKVLTCLQAR